MRAEHWYRFSCIVSALGWGSAIIGVLAPSELAFSLLAVMGNQAMIHSVILDYWLRMCSLAFVFIGILSALCVWESYRVLRMPLGVFNIGCAIALLIWNSIIGVQSSIQMIDPVFLLITGIPMTLWAFVKARPPG